jgi:hypothetical protein
MLRTQTLGNGESFLGIESGPEVTVSTAANDAAGLLGWDHYGTGDIGVNMSAAIGSPHCVRVSEGNLKS